MNNQEDPKEREVIPRPQHPMSEWARGLLERRHDAGDIAGDITKKVRIEVPDFEGKVDATQFVDWLVAIEEYFDWYDMMDDRRVRFSKMKLVGLAKIWWTGVEGDIRRMGLPPISMWEEMKAKLREKYMPTNYYDKLCDQLINLRQNNMSVAEHMHKYDELKTRSHRVEDSRQTLARCKAGLKPEIKRELLHQPLYSLEHAFQVALDMEEHVGYLSNRRTGVVPLEAAHKRHHDTSRDIKPGSNHLSNPSIGFKPSSFQMADPKGKGIKCFKCQQPGHMAYNCPRKNLHIDLESEEEPKPPNEENGSSFDYGAYDPVDLDDEKLDGQLVFVVRRILVVPKVEEEDWCQTSIFQMLV